MKNNGFKWLCVLTGVSGLAQAQRSNIELNDSIKPNVSNNISSENNLYSDNKNSQKIENKKDNFQENQNTNTEDEIFSTIKNNSVFKSEKNNKIIASSSKEYNSNLSENDLKLNQLIKNSNTSMKYGTEYFFNSWHKSYKGKNDKGDKYQYEGIYKRSDDIFMRTISPNSSSYNSYTSQALGTENLENSALTNPNTRNSDNNYGIANIKIEQEPIVSNKASSNPAPAPTPNINLNVTTKPMEFDKNKTSITLPVIMVNDLQGAGTALGTAGITMPALTYTATNLTSRQKLMNALKYYANAGTPIMGQQHGIDVSFSPQNASGYDSDIYAVTGKYPAVIGMHFGEQPTHWTKSVQQNSQLMADYIKKANSLGAVFTASSEIPNPIKYPINHDGKSDDRTGNPDLDQFSSTGAYANQFNTWIQTIVETAKLATAPDGTPIPWILRVFHEQNGNWPWWGEPNQSHAKIKAAFRRVHDALVAAGVRDQILLAYAPNGDFGGGSDLNRYMADYPGDDVIDVLGYDAYWQAATQSEANWINLVAGDMRMIANQANSTGKVAALTEYGRLGSHAMSATNSTWFQTPVAQALQGTGTAYAMTWTQWSGEYQLPWSGHIAENDMKTAPWLLAPINLNAGSPINTVVTAGNLNIIQNVNLNNPADPFYNSNFNLSNITLDAGNTISGSTIAGNKNYILGQTNYVGSSGNNAVQVINKGTINFAGNNTTALFADNGTVTNDITGTIKMTGTGNVGMLGAANSITENKGNIEIRSQSVGIYGANALPSNDIWGNKNISITNSGNIATTAGSKDVVGIFAANNGAVSTISSSGNIDLSNATNSIGIAASNGTLQVTGNVLTGDNSVGIYTVGENISVGQNSILSTGNNSVNILLSGDNQTLNSQTDKVIIGNNSFGYTATGQNNNITTGYVGNTNPVTLNTNSVFLYSADKTGNITNYNHLKSQGNQNYGLITAGKLSNYGDIDFGTGTGNVGIYSYSKNATTTPQAAENFGTIKVSQSTTGNIGIGMAAGYKDGLGYVKNSGTIKVTTPDSVGMYATGNGSIAENAGRIELSGTSRNIGMYADNGATALNTGTITTTGTGNNGQIGITVINGILDNRGNISIDASNGYGLVLSNALIKNYGRMNITTGNGAVPILEEKTTTNTGGTTGLEKAMGTDGIDRIRINTVNGTITLNEIPQETQLVNIVNPKASSNIANPISSVGIYVDTSGTAQTNPINNLSALGLKTADLVIGTEAVQNTDKKYIQLGQNITAPFNSMIQNSGINDWNVYSGSLTWMAGMTQNGNGIGDVYLAKVPYTVFAGDKENTRNTFNFLDGLEQRYGIEKDGSEKELFNKLNNIGNNEEILFKQAVDEMMGHQYANVQSRIKATGDTVTKEINNLLKEETDQNNRIKIFGSKNEYNTGTAGIINYKNDAYGVAYVHENDPSSDNTTGWYAGAVNNNFKFKDIGKSKENQMMLKGGVFKTTALDKDKSLKWTISGEGFFGINNMNRRFLVVDNIFNAKADYYSYGAGMRNEIGKEIKLNNKMSIKPYGALNMEYGRFSRIKEKDGEIRLEVKENDYFSIKPEIGAEFKYVQPLTLNTTLTFGAGLAYETELGKLDNADTNRARVAYTDANWYNLRNEKENRRGNAKFDLNLGIQNQMLGITTNLGYDTKGDNIRGGLGIKASF